MPGGIVISGKIWGTTEAVLATPAVELHRLTVKPRHQCSMHRHLRKWNAFYVISGRLLIDVEKADYALTDTTELGPGMSMAVPPGEYHRFRTEGEPCEALELYYLAPLSEDIERRDHGGPV